MTYLVEGNVLCETTKASPNGRVVEWLSANEGRLLVDPIILGEMPIGILAFPAGRKRSQLQDWFSALARTIECLPWDAAVSKRWAELVVALRNKGRRLPLLDSMITATALEYRLTLVTRNTRDFKQTGVKLVDPFAS